jgi:hypothetical protein
MGMLNVRNFGAKGDGVTDDTAALQAASDYALAWDDAASHSGYPADTYGGSATVILEGTFVISNTLTIATHLDASRATLRPCGSSPLARLGFCSDCASDTNYAAFTTRRKRGPTTASCSLCASVPVLC